MGSTKRQDGTVEVAGAVGGRREDARTANARANRERVYAAAIEIFGARGYDQATMDEIAGRAGVSRRTAFNHFPAKSDLATEWAIRRAETAFRMSREAGGARQSAGDRVQSYFHELAVLTERDWDETRQLTTGWLRGVPNHRSQVADGLREWLQGDGSLGADHVLAVNVLFDVFQGALLRWLPRAAPAAGEFTAETDAAIAVVLAGLRAS
jgi:AcrR family transcriptional regulator